MRKSKAETEKAVMAILLDGEPEKNNIENANDDLAIADLVPYANHPFKLYEGERLYDMIRSIRERGVIVPVIVRPVDKGDGTYEILSGHNRVNAAKLAGLKKVPGVVKTGLTDDEAKLYYSQII